MSKNKENVITSEYMCDKEKVMEQIESAIQQLQNKPRSPFSILML